MNQQSMFPAIEVKRLSYRGSSNTISNSEQTDEQKQHRSQKKQRQNKVM